MNIQQQRNQNGKQAEDALAEYHKVCLYERVAKVVRVATPMQIVGPIGHGFYKCVFSKSIKQGPDYNGHMLDGTARRVLIECKHVSDPESAFLLSAVTDYERECLNELQAAGGVCVLAIIRGPLKTLSAFDWGVVKDLRKITANELDDHRERHGSAYLKRWSNAPTKT